MSIFGYYNLLLLNGFMVDPYLAVYERIFIYLTQYKSAALRSVHASSVKY